MDIENPLANTYDNEDEDNAMDTLFDVFDDLHCARKFEQSNALLETVEVDRLNTTLLVGVLSITYQARSHLPSRTAVVQKIEERLTLLAPDRVVSLVKGLRG